MVPVPSRTPQRGRRPTQELLATACALVVLVGCSGESTPAQPQETPTVETTPLGDYDTGDLTLVRGEFCDRVSEGAITAALGAESAETASWEPGRRLPGTRDISNEFGCSWATPSSMATARAWVFTPPITRSRAADFAGEPVGTKCEELEDAPALGRPGVAQRCELDSGATRTGYYGLVGDAWVGCEVDRDPRSSTSPGEQTESALVGEWCVAVLEALRTA